MKVYTKRGDGGETSLYGGDRVRKDHLRVEAYGAVDELNAALGLALAELEGQDCAELLRGVQRRLFDIGGELACPDVERREAAGKGLPRVRDKDVAALEGCIDGLEAELEPLRSFILPGGSRASGLLHLARTVCRRAERRVVSLAERDAVAPVVLRYLNRLSDCLFELARAANRRAGVADTEWKGREG